MDKFGRIRRRLNFELNISKDDQRDMFWRLKELRSCRQYVTTIRNALRLFFDLCDGNTAVLRELFPAIVNDLEYNPLVAEFREYMERAKMQPQPVSVQSATFQAETNELPSMFVDGGAGGSDVTPDVARAEFASGFGDLFGGTDGDEDDLWD